MTQSIRRVLFLASLTLVLMLLVPAGSAFADKPDAASLSDADGEISSTDAASTSINSNSNQTSETGDASIQDTAEANPTYASEADSANQPFPDEESHSEEEAETNYDCMTDEISDANSPVESEAAGSSESTATHQVSQTINNELCSIANSGEADVAESEGGGTAMSGEAEALATIINVIQSTTGLTGSELALFIQDVYGDQFGDILIDPETLEYITADNCNACGDSATINIHEDSQINNDIYVDASSGNATVSGNGSDGSATTGDATAILNLINIVNSIVSSNQTVVGIVNIYGSLDGDILLPQELIDSLLNGNDDTFADASLGVNSSQSINNNLNLNATTGNATVVNNGQGGGAASGNASTSISSHNVVNDYLFGQDALMVFVNVLGEWYGLVVGAPDGETSVVLGSEGGQCSSCSGPTDTSVERKIEVNNNVHLNATTGNATVVNNGQGGSAASGNALAALNLVNIVNSTFSLNGSLYIMFINVLGVWNGSFGIDTSAGEAVVWSDSSDGPKTQNVGELAKLVDRGPSESISNYSEQTIDIDAEESEQKVLPLSTANHIGSSNSQTFTSPSALVRALLGGLLGTLVLLGAGRTRKAHKDRLGHFAQPTIYQPEAFSGYNVRLHAD